MDTGWGALRGISLDTRLGNPLYDLKSNSICGAAPSALEGRCN